jgi:purine-binding chemotaxis protein CheW
VLERGDRLKLVRFSIAGTVYAFEVDHVEEVVQPLAITELPELPAFVLGVGNHRGSVLPIVDLRARFGLATPESSRASKWVLTKLPIEGRAEPLRIGFLVDRVLDVHGTDELPGPAPRVGGFEERSAVAGVVTIEGGLTFVLDLGRLVGDLVLPSGRALLAEPA